jgi:multidrug efflux pump subunit AcrB
MGIINFSLSRRVTVSMCAVALVLFGLVAYSRLPLNLMPDLSYPSLTVETRFPGAAPEEVESLVSRPIEEMVGVVSGVQRLTSISRPGLSQVTVEFGWDRDMDFAALDVRQKLDLVVLPREAEKSVVLRFDPGNEPITRLYLTADKGSEIDLYQLRYLGRRFRSTWTSASCPWLECPSKKSTRACHAKTSTRQAAVCMSARLATWCAPTTSSRVSTISSRPSW